MKVLALAIITGLQVSAQCPTVTPVQTSICGTVSVRVGPTIDPPGNYTYQWTAAPGTPITGANSATMIAYEAGVYTLTLTDPVASCTVVSTHTVSGCPTSIEEVNLSHEPKQYFDLQGNPATLRPGVILIEQVGDRRKKILLLQ